MFGEERGADVSNTTRYATSGGNHMLEAIAIVLLLITVAVWLRVATPQLVDAWVAFARELDPSRAPQHAALFSPAPRTTP